MSPDLYFIVTLLFMAFLLGFVYPPRRTSLTARVATGLLIAWFGFLLILAGVGILALTAS